MSSLPPDAQCAGCPGFFDEIDYVKNHIRSLDTHNPAGLLIRNIEMSDHVCSNIFCNRSFKVIQWRLRNTNQETMSERDRNLLVNLRRGIFFCRECHQQFWNPDPNHIYDPNRFRARVIIPVHELDVGSNNQNNLTARGAQREKSQNRILFENLNNTKSRKF